MAGKTAVKTAFAPIENTSSLSWLGMDSRSPEQMMANYAKMDIASLQQLKTTDPLKYNEMQKGFQAEQTMQNSQPGMMETAGTALGAANTAFGLYDNIWGGAANMRTEQIGALKDQRAALNQEVAAKDSYRKHLATQFS